MFLPLAALLPLLLSLAASLPLPDTSSTSGTNTNNVISAAFPTSIGYEGDFTTGAAPFLAQTDNMAKVSGTPTKSYTLPQPLETSNQSSDQNKQQLQLQQDSDKDENIFNLMGTYSPYHPAPRTWGSNVFEYGLPQGDSQAPQCQIKQVHSLSRHGSRYDTKELKLAEWLTGEVENFTASGELQFLNDWVPNAGQAALGTYGNQQLFDKGVRTFFRYGGLYNDNSKKLVARTTTQERMTMLAEYFLAGFFGLNWQQYVNLELLVEADNFNTTLYPSAVCPNKEKLITEADDALDNFQHEYLHDTKKKLNKMITGTLKNSSEPFELKTKHVYAMQRLCAFETNTLGYSRFCHLFSQKDWENFAILINYKYYYKNSFGNPTARARGIGWLNEFQARLTNSTPSEIPQSTQNSTVNANPELFPLDQSLYFDFTHDTVIVNILTALGINIFKTEFQIKDNGATIELNNTKDWQTSHIVPFAAHLVFEVIECDKEVPADRWAGNNTESVGNGKTKYIHALLNDRTLPLDQQSIPVCEPRADGWCEFDTFVEYLDTLYKEAEFEESCHGNYTVGEVTNGVPS